VLRIFLKITAIIGVYKIIEKRIAGKNIKEKVITKRTRKEIDKTK
jgi:hypothetical protein